MSKIFFIFFEIFGHYFWICVFGVLDILDIFQLWGLLVGGLGIIYFWIMDNQGAGYYQIFSISGFGWPGAWGLC